MKHVTVSLEGIDEIVGDRFLQSVEFEHGKALAALLSGQLPTAKLSSKLRLNSAAEGIFLTGPSAGSGTKYLVIDTEQSRLFESLTDSECLFVFQKLLRFAKKAWQGLALNFSEHMIAGTSKAVLFPFRGFKPAPFRVTVEREPMADRLAKRGHAGAFWLAYKAGYEGADPARETASLTNFRKVYEAVPEIREKLQTSTDEKINAAIVVSQLSVVQLPEASGFAFTSVFRRYDDWLPLLTTQQQRFVTTAISGPFRIEGAAGTGKTLCLMLKAVFALRAKRAANQPFHVVFITHSDATKRTISEVLSVMEASEFVTAEKALAAQSLKVCTLSELCAEQLRQAISESEFIDRDAMESKDLQLLYISEAFSEAMKKDFSSHERFLSPTFAAFLKSETPWKVVQMLQHEISVVIKGRAAESLDNYKKMPPLKYGLPISGDADKGFVFAIFRLYQEKLGDVGQFDTDDVVLTTVGQLDTPIWRRRRAREGYDAVFIDETHLFNINELHLFHFFTKHEGPYPIVYSIDRSQAVGDRGWTSEDIARSLTNPTDGLSEDAETIKTIFRSSPDIINLAFSIVSSGATLFTNFDNPMEATSSGFVEADEKLAARPQYFNVTNEDALIENAFARAEQMQRDMNCRRSDILIVVLDQKLLERLCTFASEKNKPILVLRRRGDLLAVEGAKKSGQFVVGHADYVGGLEFLGVTLVGIDGGRVPPVGGDENDSSSKNFLSYSAHNRLYVAVSRAKYRVEMLGEKARGPSRIVTAALTSGILVERDLQ